jgi:hypothetical protein
MVLESPRLVGGENRSPNNRRESYRQAFGQTLGPACNREKAEAAYGQHRLGPGRFLGWLVGPQDCAALPSP